MRLYLLLLAVSNIFMLHVADIFSFFKCRKIVKIILNQCNKNTNYIEECIKEWVKLKIITNNK